MRKALAVLALALIPFVAHAQAVSDATRSEVCTAGYSASVRPPSSYVAQVKRQMLDDAGLSQRAGRGYVVDHIVPLELGGEPRDRANLQLQTVADARIKDRAENALHRLVCRGRMSLDDAQAYFSDESWREDFR